MGQSIGGSFRGGGRGMNCSPPLVQSPPQATNEAHHLPFLPRGLDLHGQHLGSPRWLLPAGLSSWGPVLARACCQACLFTVSGWGSTKRCPLLWMPECQTHSCLPSSRGRWLYILLTLSAGQVSLPIWSLPSVPTDLLAQIVPRAHVVATVSTLLCPW